MKSAKLFFVLILLCNAAMVNSCGFIGDKNNTASGETQNELSNSGIEDSEAYLEEGNNLVNCICQLKSAPQYQSNCAPPYCS
jgi:hypothetical protein